MKKLLLIYIIICSYNSFAQEIIWKNVDEDEVRPVYFKSGGYLYLSNGDITPSVDLLIHFDNQVIYYKNDVTNKMYEIFPEDFRAVAINEYPLQSKLSPFDLYGSVAEEIKASLRKPLYSNPDLNDIYISSTIKKGFFNRSQPKFYLNESDELDVKNKEVIKAKLLQITPYFIEFLDNTGDIVVQRFKKKITVEGATDKEQKKQDRKTTRILNLKFGDKYFSNIEELYRTFYIEYRKRFYEDLENFKNSFIGQQLKEILNLWGPHSEEFEIDDNSKLYVWNFEQKLTEIESSKTINSLSSQFSSSNIEASLSSRYGIDSEASKINLGGYGSIMNSYSRIRGKSYLNWYSSNITNQYTTTTTSETGSSYEVDVTKKIAIIVDENLIVKKVLEKDFLPEPYYGVRLKFYE